MTVYAPPAALVNSDDSWARRYLDAHPERTDTRRAPPDPAELIVAGQCAAYWAEIEPEGPATPGDDRCWRFLTIDTGVAGAGVPCLKEKGHSGRCGVGR